MNKKIVVLSNSTPSQLGYNDYFYLIEKDIILYEGDISCCPNPPVGKYGWVSLGTYPFQCIEHPKFKKCLLIHDGDPIASRIPNPRHNNQKIVSEIFIHEGNIGYKNPLWRGSRGCLTLHRDKYPGFIKRFQVSDVGLLQITDTMEPIYRYYKIIKGVKTKYGDLTTKVDFRF